MDLSEKILMLFIRKCFESGLIKKCIWEKMPSDLSESTENIFYKKENDPQDRWV